MTLAPFYCTRNNDALRHELTVGCVQAMDDRSIELYQSLADKQQERNTTPSEDDVSEETADASIYKDDIEVGSRYTLVYYESNLKGYLLPPARMQAELNKLTASGSTVNLLEVNLQVTNA